MKHNIKDQFEKDKKFNQLIQNKIQLKRANT